MTAQLAEEMGFEPMCRLKATTAFRVRAVTTTSILFQILNFVCFRRRLSIMPALCGPLCSLRCAAFALRARHNHFARLRYAQPSSDLWTKYYSISLLMLQYFRVNVNYFHKLRTRNPLQRQQPLDEYFQSNCYQYYAAHNLRLISKICAKLFAQIHRPYANSKRHYCDNARR